jgi:hypothetical protein
VLWMPETGCGWAAHLRAVHHADVAQFERHNLTPQIRTRVCTPVHDVQLGHHADGSVATRVHLPPPNPSVSLCSCWDGGLLLNRDSGANTVARTERAIMSASELARSVLAGDTARIRHVSCLMKPIAISRICSSMLLGWLPTGTCAYTYTLAA